MKRGRGIISVGAGLLLMLCTTPAKGDAIVSVGLFSGLSPDPVNVVVGEAVFWFDGDGLGPYTIFGFGPAFDTPGGIRFLQTGSFMYFDDLGDIGTVNVSPNAPPSVTITNPTDGAVFIAPASFDFEADASDADVGVSDVEFYVGTNFVDDVFFPPYATAITDLPAGAYVLTVIVYDLAGATATNSINITVQNTAAIQLTAPTLVGNQFRFSATGLTPGKTNVLQSTTNLASSISWTAIATNVAAGSSASFTNTINAGRRFFRLLQLP